MFVYNLPAVSPVDEDQSATHSDEYSVYFASVTIVNIEGYDRDFFMNESYTDVT